MITFEDFRPEGSLPVYRQIVLYIKRGAVAGSIRNGDELPSRRMLSALLGINPNTVQKAFSLLEEEGLITSRAGAKSFMTLDEERLTQIRNDLLSEDIQIITSALRQMGITKEEALALISRFWEEPR
ncbi:MAG: GntR family transcriptional regulator [Firmicutes bacterium]|nr:GntR family transcriptional regulator [Bacillota bacterium]